MERLTVIGILVCIMGGAIAAIGGLLCADVESVRDAAVGGLVALIGGLVAVTGRYVSAIGRKS